jgi:hypothetical protein
LIEQSAESIDGIVNGRRIRMFRRKPIVDSNA